MLNRKSNLLQIAAAAVLLGAGGLIGNVASGVVAYDGLAKSLAAQDAVAKDPASTKEDLVIASDQSVAVFLSLDASAKAAWQRAQPKKK